MEIIELGQYVEYNSKEYICDGILQNIRNDGRRNNQFRYLSIVFLIL